jgi:hypothetical protein
MDQILLNIKTCQEDTGKVLGLTVETISFVYQHSSQDEMQLRHTLIDSALMAEAEEFWSLLKLLKESGDEHVQDFEQHVLMIQHDRLKDCQEQLRRRGETATTLFGRDPCAYHKHPGQPANYSCTKVKEPVST